MFFRKYAKGFMSLAVTLITLIVGALTDNNISTAEWLTVGGAFVATLAVVGVPNSPSNPALKTVAQVLAPVLGGLATAIVTPDGITASVLLNLAIAAAGAAGVYGVRNSGDTYTRLGSAPSVVRAVD
jgi:hypothetical protein